MLISISTVALIDKNCSSIPACHKDAVRLYLCQDPFQKAIIVHQK